jgi:hypothetical protein
VSPCVTGVGTQPPSEKHPKCHFKCFLTAKQKEEKKNETFYQGIYGVAQERG